jgi:hypothetical protein
LLMRRIVRVVGFMVLGFIAGWGTTRSLYAEEGYLTVTFGASPSCHYPGTLTQEGNVFRFDLSALPSGTRIVRATLAVPDKGHQHGAEVRVGAVGPGEARPLSLRPPMFKSFDATNEVKAWVATPATNRGFVVASNGGVDFRELPRSRSGGEFSRACGARDPRRFAPLGRSSAWPDVSHLEGTGGHCGRRRAGIREA